MVGVRIDVEGFGAPGKPSKRIARMKQKLRDGDPALMAAIADAVHEDVLTTFATETDPWGRPWWPRSETTMELYEQGGLFGTHEPGVLFDRAEKILYLFGRLRAGVARFSGPKEAGVRMSNKEAKVYGRVHQYGNPANRLPNRAGGRPAPIPARPFLPLVREGGRAVARLPGKLKAEIEALLAAWARTLGDGPE